MARFRFPVVAVFALALVIALAVAPSRATAQVPPPDAGGDDASAFLRDFAGAEQSLSTDDCAGACRALRAMQRAAERLCALEQGTRCAEVRARVEEATRRVRAACPECAAAGGAPPPVKVTDADRREVVAASAPPAERGRGGCGGCALGGTGGADGALALAVAALAAARRKRSRRL